MIPLHDDDPLTFSNSAGVEIFGKTVPLVTFAIAQCFIFISA